MDGEDIAEVGPAGMAAPAAAQVIDASDRLLMPGLVNAHTHGHGALSKGLGDKWSLELLLNAAGLNLIAFSRFGGHGIQGQVFVLFLIVLAAAEAVVGLALVIAIHRRMRTIDVDRTDTLKG